MDRKWVAALDVGATHVSAGLVSNTGELRARQEIPTRQNGDSRPLRVRLVELTAALLDAAAKEGLTPVGIAVGSPGIVDTENGVIVVAGNIPDLFGLPLGQELNEEFGLPVQVENDVNAQAVGEMVFGVARGKKNFILLTIGTDLGGGIIIDGKLHRGAHMIAAEFGHLTLDLAGKACVCGGIGCAREIVSGAGLAEYARDTLPENSAVIKAAGERAQITARHVFELARANDPDAQELIEEFSRRFGATIANIMKVLDPELVVVAGEIIRTENQLMSRIMHWTREFYFPMPQLPDFRVSELTKETAVQGPAACFFLAHHISAGRAHGKAEN